MHQPPKLHVATPKLHVATPKLHVALSMEFPGSHKKAGSVAYNPPEGQDYKWYRSGIFPANWVIIYHRSHQLRETRNNYWQYV